MLEAPGAVPTVEALPDPKTIADSATGLENGDFAPELALLDLMSGKPWRLSARVGPKASLPTKAVVVSFSASWCGPCRLSLPYLKQMEDQHGTDLEVVIVTMDEDLAGKEKEVEAVRSAGLDAPVLEATPEVLTAWLGRRRNIPHLYILNRAGEVMVQDRGFGEKVKKVLPGQIRFAMSHPEYVVRTGR
jgi:thiol-disulfide isomerase/thioredoxin